VRGRSPGSWTVLALVLLVHGSIALWFGPRWAYDTRMYSSWADTLIAHGFDYGALAAVDNSFSTRFWSLWVTIVADAKLLFGEQWSWAIFTLNVAAQGALGVLVVRTVRSVTDHAAAVWAALFLFLVCADLVHFVSVVQSDATFVALTFAVFALVARQLLAPEPGKLAAWGIIAGLTALAAFYRPTGVVLAPGVLWAFYLARTPSDLQSRWRAAGVGLALAALGVVAFAWIMQDPSRWPFEAFSRSIRDLAGEQAQGTVVWQRFETYAAPPVSLADYLALAVKRAWQYGAFVAGYLSLRHNVLGALFFVPAYALCLRTTINLWTQRSGGPRSGDRRSDVVFASLGFVAAFWFFHAAVRVEFDWRYRLPILPHLIFLAALAMRPAPARTSSPRPAPPPR